LRGISDGHATGPILSNIAETVVGTLWPKVEAEFAGPGGDHGYLNGGEMAIIAFGKLGGHELMPESDLDLVFVYDVSDDTPQSDGLKPLGASVYYMRLAQRMIGAVDALTGEGRLYEVDPRLRPSGSKGSIASRLDGFEHYYEDSAWTWEFMALTRARAVAGSPALVERLNTFIRETLTRKRDPDRLVVDVADMRARIAREFKGASRWDLKHRRGGMVDAEFIAQYLQLRHAADHPEILSTTAVTVFDNLANAGLLDRAAADELAEALRLWHRLQTVLRVTTSDDLDRENSPEGPRAAVMRAAGVDDYAQLTTMMDETAARVHAYFTSLIETPAEEARPRVAAVDASSTAGPA
jgi:glutamate-ammonia-ligase adenylyltransferase